MVSAFRSASASEAARRSRGRVRFAPGKVLLLGALGWCCSSRPARAQEAPAASLTDIKNQCADAYEATQRERAAGQLISAHRKSIFCAQSSCPEVLRGDCATWAGELANSIASVVIEARKPNGEPLTEVAVQVDGQPFDDHLDGRAQELDPGQHRFRFEADGLASTERDFVVVEGQKAQRLRITVGAAPPPDTRPRGFPTASYVLAGAGLVGLSSFALFGLSGNAKKDELNSCRPACAASLRAPIEHDYLAADFSLGVGLVSLGLATWLAIASQTGEDQSFDLRASKGAALLHYQRVF